MIENVKIMIILTLKSKFYQYFVLTKNYSNDLSYATSKTKHFVM